MSLLDEIDFSKATSARIVDATSLSDSSSVHGDRASDEDTVQVVLSLPRQEAQRLVDALSRATSSSIQDLHAGPMTRQRTSSRTHAVDASRAKSSPEVQTSLESALEEPRVTVEMQGFLETERSYTNAFHKTLSLFIDDKTFSSPSLRAAVVGYLESSNATVMETLPPHDHRVPDYLRQEIENHVNLVKTVLQRGGVFAEDFLRTRLKKLAGYIPRLEAAIAGQGHSGDGGGRPRSKAKAPVLLPRSNEPSSSLTLSPATTAANQAALAAAAEAAARSNSRHQQVSDILSQNGHLLTSPAGVNSPSVNGFGSGSGPQPSQIAIPPHVPIKAKTFVPPSLVPSQGPAPLARPEEGSPPPVLAPFDPRPNPMACLFCRQRKIRCIGHKPHPCEICVKRGFVCSYDWISRRGKRKPKGTDGSPLELPAGSVSVAVTNDSGQTLGGVPLPNAPAPPGVGIAPNIQIPSGIPISPTVVTTAGSDGAVQPFPFTFVGGLPPGGHSLPGMISMPGTVSPQEAQLNPGDLLAPSPSQQSQSRNSDSTGAVSPSTEPTANGGEGGIQIDPSLTELLSPARPPAAGRGGTSGSDTCRSCKEQGLECSGGAPSPCVNCSQLVRPCQWDGPGETIARQPMKKPTSSTDGGMDVDSPNLRKRTLDEVGVDDGEQDMLVDGSSKKQKAGHIIQDHQNLSPTEMNGMEDAVGTPNTELV